MVTMMGRASEKARDEIEFGQHHAIVQNADEARPYSAGSQATCSSRKMGSEVECECTKMGEIGGPAFLLY